MVGMGLKAAALLLGMTSMHALNVHQGPVKVLRVGHNRVELPVRSPYAHPAKLEQIEAAALKATGGGQIQAVTPSVWVGKPVWMCTVAEGRNVWHVMVDQTSLKAVSKIRVPE
ncbi:PepSY domain-containing protein [Sulfobacillus harzensis]|uniref:PepSY domain-containing protein n=1 Tax=Sulfobacillus harzensis TaxID=2729629 RepID=A0A7Y0L6P9_9FIRM|nr:PepSY domain-containing protein [Sulfobacillus harzensis]NMP24323.1 hypothetical protein [Sulfobacillus harzensis]